MSDVTELLTAIDSGDPKAADKLLPLRLPPPSTWRPARWTGIGRLCPGLFETHHPNISCWPDGSGLKIFWIHWRDLRRNLACLN